MDQLLQQLQTALTPIATAAATLFIGWAFTQLRAFFQTHSADSAEASLRAAAATAAGKLATTVTSEAASAPNATVASVISPGAVQAAAASIADDFKPELKLTGFTTSDVASMIMAELPRILGMFNPALGAAAGAAETAAKNISGQKPGP
jgi:hypothetical protein